MLSSKQISQTACNRAHTSTTGVKQDTFQWSIKQSSFTLTSYRCPKEQATFLSGILVPASYGVSLGEEGVENRRYSPLLLSSSNSEISKILTLSTIPFRFTINDHFFSENKMGIFWFLLTFFFFQNTENQNQLQSALVSRTFTFPQHRTLKGTFTSNRIACISQSAHKTGRHTNFVRQCWKTKHSEWLQNLANVL